MDDPERGSAHLVLVDHAAKQLVVADQHELLTHRPFAPLRRRDARLRINGERSFSLKELREEPRKHLLAGPKSERRLLAAAGHHDRRVRAHHAPVAAPPGQAGHRDAEHLLVRLARQKAIAARQEDARVDVVLDQATQRLAVLAREVLKCVGDDAVALRPGELALRKVQVDLIAVKV